MTEDKSLVKSDQFLRLFSSRRVTYSRLISYAPYPIRVALSLTRFPLRFALTYPRRLSRPLICQALVACRLVELRSLIGYR